MTQNWLEAVHDKYKGMDDIKWCNLVHQSIAEPEKFVNVLPGLPDLKLQKRLNGQPAINTVERSKMFYRFLKEVAERHGRPIGPASKILDFGAGWGRLFRFFLKDVQLENLVAADVNASLISLWKRDFPAANFFITPPVPPLSIPIDCKFDLIYAHSVFSHLPGELSDAWAQHLSAKLAPGGIFVLTTFGLSSNTPKRARSTGLPQKKVRDRFLRGELLFLKPQTDNFGVTFMPKEYVVTHWKNYFELVDYIDYRTLYPQAIVILKKR